METTFWDKKYGRNFLKLVAVFTMLCDHIAYVLISQKDYPQLYNVLRLIGRIAFPLFCFMLVEGFLYTKNRKKYFFRLLIFAFISEIPFNLAISNTIFDIYNQNVIWTLLISFLVLLGLEKYSFNFYMKCLCMFLGSALAFIMHVDYSIYGVLIISIFYLCRNERFKMLVLLMLMLAAQGQNEAFGILSIPFIMAYDAEKIEKPLPKYFCYIFYPAHLFILYIIKIFILNL